MKRISLSKSKAKPVPGTHQACQPLGRLATIPEDVNDTDQHITADFTNTMNVDPSKTQLNMTGQSANLLGQTSDLQPSGLTGDSVDSANSFRSNKSMARIISADSGRKSRDLEEFSDDSQTQESKWDFWGTVGSLGKFLSFPEPEKFLRNLLDTRNDFSVVDSTWLKFLYLLKSGSHLYNRDFDRVVQRFNYKDYLAPNVVSWDFDGKSDKLIIVQKGNPCDRIMIKNIQGRTLYTLGGDFFNHYKKFDMVRLVPSFPGSGQQPKLILSSL